MDKHISYLLSIIFIDKQYYNELPNFEFISYTFDSRIEFCFVLLYDIFVILQ